MAAHAPQNGHVPSAVELPAQRTVQPSEMIQDTNRDVYEAEEMRPEYQQPGEGNSLHKSFIGNEIDDANPYPDVGARSSELPSADPKSANYLEAERNYYSREDSERNQYDAQFDRGYDDAQFTDERSYPAHGKTNTDAQFANRRAPETRAPYQEQGGSRYDYPSRNRAYEGRDEYFRQDNYLDERETDRPVANPRRSKMYEPYSEADSHFEHKKQETSYTDREMGFVEQRDNTFYNEQGYEPTSDYPVPRERDRYRTREGNRDPEAEEFPRRRYRQYDTRYDDDRYRISPPTDAVRRRYGSPPQARRSKLYEKFLIRIPSEKVADYENNQRMQRPYVEHKPRHRDYQGAKDAFQFQEMSSALPKYTTVAKYTPMRARYPSPHKVKERRSNKHDAEPRARAHRQPSSNERDRRGHPPNFSKYEDYERERMFYEGRKNRAERDLPFVPPKPTNLQRYGHSHETRDAYKSRHY